MLGFQAAGAAPIVTGQPVDRPMTIATAIRIGNPASWTAALAARDESGGLIAAVTDREILSAYRLLARAEGVFVEPASAAGVAGLLAAAADGRVAPGSTRRLHGDRQRAQGPGLGDRRGAGPGHRPGRRRRRGGRRLLDLRLTPRSRLRASSSRHAVPDGALRRAGEQAVIGASADGPGRSE